MSKILQFPLNKKRSENNDQMQRIRKSLDNINRLMSQLKEMSYTPPPQDNCNNGKEEEEES